jgi:hypothetical protein
MEHMTMAYLNGVVVSKQGIGLDKYEQVIMENKFLVKLNDSHNTLNFGILKGFQSGLNTKFQM